MLYSRYVPLSSGNSVIAVIPVWNARDDLKSCLESLLNQEHNNFRLVIADNNSDELIDDIVQDYQKRFRENNFAFEYIKLDENYGPTGAMNKVLEKKYKGENYILRIDSDIQINDKSVLSKLLSFLNKNSDIGIIGPKMIVPALDREIVAAYWASTLGTIKNKEKSEPAEADLVNAGFVLIKGELYKKLRYLWSELLFYSWEELDLSERARKIGYKTFYYPYTTVIHNIRTMSHRSKRQLYYDFRNLLLVNWKYGNTFSRFTNFFVLFFPRFMFWLFVRTQFDLTTLFRAIRDFLILRKKYVDEYK
jgi:GT2 family glycosyltransferase